MHAYFTHPFLTSVKDVPAPGALSTATGRGCSGTHPPESADPKNSSTAVQDALAGPLRHGTADPRPPGASGVSRTHSLRVATEVSL